MNTNEPNQEGAVVVINYWLVTPIIMMLTVNAFFNLSIANYSEAVLSAWTLVLGLMFIEKEKAVASLMIVNRTLQLSLVKVLEKMVKLKGEKDGRETEVSRD